MHERDELEQRWRRDFAAVARTIPDAWLMRDGDFVGILPEYGDRPQVRLYRGLTQVGYARGWL